MDKQICVNVSYKIGSELLINFFNDNICSEEEVKEEEITVVIDRSGTKRKRQKKNFPKNSINIIKRNVSSISSERTLIIFLI